MDNLYRFMPHGMCFNWDPALLAAHIVADAFIALAYYAIPFFLIRIARKRGDIPFTSVFWMFAVFILSCGTTHLFSIWVIWHPDYWAEAGVKWITAIASVLTAGMLVALTPKILQISSPAQSEELITKFQREHSIATTYQNASLPQLPEHIPGLEIDAIYRPAISDLEIGGDWYDAVSLLDGRTLVSIGDVTGKGLEASVIMSKVRQAIRVAAQIQIDPAAILDAADLALRAEYPQTIVTAFVGIFDRIEETFAFASAGHPGPILRHPNGEVEKLDDSTLPLGLRMREESDQSFVHNLVENSLFIFYTDGLVEATHDLALGEQRLSAAVTSNATYLSPNPAAHIQAMIIDEEPRDDIAILTVRIIPLEESKDLETWTFDARDRAAACTARDGVLSFLRDRNVQELRLANAEMVYAELIGNVFRYTPGPVQVRIEWHRGRSILHVYDEGTGFKHLPRLPRDIYAESGRGLFLISSLTEDFHISRRPIRGSHARAVLTPLSLSSA